MKNRLTSLSALLLIVLVAAACGGGATPAPAPAAPATAVPPKPASAATEAPVKAPTAAPSSACEDYFGFCVAAQVSGAVTGEGRGGWGSSTNTDCQAWAVGGAARILELPNLLAAGEQQIAVALTRVGAYTGPGTYTLTAMATGGAMPDMFPAVRTAGRMFNNGADTTASVTINADGSGSLDAKNLMEMDAMQGATPDPNARLGFTMRWTCQGQK